jgi:hypothetical protein
VDVSDRRVAAIVRRCQDLPGSELFQYLDEDGLPEMLCALRGDRRVLDGSLGRIAASIPRRASSVGGERIVMKLLERVKRSAAAS